MQSDNLHRYGSVSRFLHWLMALGFLVVFFTSLSLTFAEDAEWTNGFRDVHKVMGYFLMILILLRLCWRAITIGKRPPADSLLVHLGHWALYALMFAVPLLGLLRQYGGARAPLKIGDFVLLPTASEKIEWMVKLGSQWHSVLGWALLALSLGHIAMVVVHRLKGDDVLPRMLGNKGRRH